MDSNEGHPRDVNHLGAVASGVFLNVEVLAYVVDPQHAQYAGRLARPDLLRLVLQGRGVSGDNADYVRNTHTHLLELGIPDETLAWLDAHLDSSDVAPGG